MDPISLATAGKSSDMGYEAGHLILFWIGIAFVGTAANLAQTCLQLYEFWESMQDAPAAVQVVKNDLMLLARVLKDISVEVDLSPSVAFTLDACQVKVNVRLLGGHGLEPLRGQN